MRLSTHPAHNSQHYLPTAADLTVLRVRLQPRILLSALSYVLSHNSARTIVFPITLAML